ncbi:aromatic acid exporter family protein [Streptomyces caniferus]|uniref:aromatic acid exporter family protein n=1 Tax=Streptomyces caniferus TaxID=285557 RepID=UPI003F4CCFAE
MVGHAPQATLSEAGRVARIGQWWRRALGSDGPERHTALLIGKSTLAAMIAWVISSDLLNAQSPAFAPFSAVLIMQVTIYQSLVQSLRYVGAVAAGVAVQIALGFLVGPQVVTFALVALVVLLIGRWSALGVVARRRDQLQLPGIPRALRHVSGGHHRERPPPQHPGRGPLGHPGR